MTCAKKKVTCFLVAEDGSIFIGSNNCNNPQGTCPRKPWEGYEKCKSICDQPMHAEIDALNKAGDKAKNAKVFVVHHRVCHECRTALDKAGVHSVTLVQ
jgi:deoxycytidylate deaminase